MKFLSVSDKRLAISSKQLAVSSRHSSGRRQGFCILAHRLLLIAYCILLTSCLLSCSVPNLEPANCIEARGVVKEFYSFHFGNDMRFTKENLKLRAEFLTPEFTASLQNEQMNGDVFTTGSDDFAKAFRVGECAAVSLEETIFQVILFWRDDVRSEQKVIMVGMIKYNGKWLINRVVY